MLKFLQQCGALLLFITSVGPGLEWLWHFVMADDSPPPLLWALAMTTTLSMLWIAVTYCTYRQGILRDEIQRCARAKKMLERQLFRHPAVPASRREPK